MLQRSGSDSCGGSDFGQAVAKHVNSNSKLYIEKKNPITKKKKKILKRQIITIQRNDYFPTKAKF